MNSREALDKLFMACDTDLLYEQSGILFASKLTDIIEQDLDKLEKLEKVIEILKNNYFTVTSNANSETGYIMCVESDITQQEYELLKEVLKEYE